MRAARSEAAAQERSTIRREALERAGDNPIVTLIQMIDALRVYDAAQKAARAVEETVSRAVNDVGRLELESR